MQVVYHGNEMRTSMSYPSPLTRYNRLFCLLVSTIIFLCAHSQHPNKVADSIILWNKNHPTIDSQYIINLHKISYRLSETDVKKSFDYYQQVSRVSDSVHFTYGKALAQINLGLLLSNSANLEASNNAYFKAIEYAEQCGSLRLKAVSLNNIGESFKMLKDYEKSRQYTRQAIELNTQLKAWRGVAINYEQLAQCDMEEGLYASAKKNFNEGMTFAMKVNEPYIYALFYLGFGKINAETGREDSAIYYFSKSLKEATEGNDLRNAHNVYLAMAKYLKNVPARQKLDDLDSALVIARNTEYLKGVADAAEQLSVVYDGLNNKDSSLFFFRIYRSASDSLFSENNKRNVIIKESEWMINRKELENDHLKRITALQSKELQFKNGLLLATIIVFILLTVVAILIYYSLQFKRKQAASQQKQMEAEMKNQMTELEFKAFKAQLNPHFIFNYLNSISAYILLSQPEKASDMIKKFSKMLRNVLENSEQNTVPLSDDIKTIQQYLELMVEITTPSFTYKVIADEAVLNQMKLVPPLFIQPYVENAIVHGIKQSDGENLFLEVAYRKNNQALEITITDNGTGFDTARMKRNPLLSNGHIHLGLSVTEKRILVFSEKNQYRSTINFSTPFKGTAQEGTRVTVVIDGLF